MKHTLVQSKSEWCNTTQWCTINYTIKRKRIKPKKVKKIDYKCWFRDMLRFGNMRHVTCRRCWRSLNKVHNRLLPSRNIGIRRVYLRMCPLANEVHAFATSNGSETSPIFQIPNVQLTKACCTSKLYSKFHFTAYQSSQILKSIIYGVANKWNNLLFKNHWVNHTWLTISRVIGRWILSWP